MFVNSFNFKTLKSFSTTESPIIMYIIQYQSQNHHHTQIGLIQEQGYFIERIDTDMSLYEMALSCIKDGIKFQDLIKNSQKGEIIAYQDLLKSQRILPPITVPFHQMFITGTGLTHLGSGQTRGQMHSADTNKQPEMTDSMKMFQLGLEQGKPRAGEIGVQPEWFYKGNGQMLKASGQPLCRPSFALDGGEEPELVGIYLVYENQVYRLGFAIGNEFSDHMTEKQNYLYLAHSKLRECSIGPEIYLGDLPEDIKGKTTIKRQDQILWEKEFLTGEANMSHSIHNLEQHHFKYDLFRTSGDVHLHFFGTSTLSFQDQIQIQAGDEIMIEMDLFHHPLINPVQTSHSKDLQIKTL